MSGILRVVLSCVAAILVSETAFSAELSTAHAEGICKTAGIETHSHAFRYRWFFRPTGFDDRTHSSAVAVFPIKARFNTNVGVVEKEVNATADYADQLTADKLKTVNIRYQAGIANLKHEHEDFKFFLGYKVRSKDDPKKFEDHWVEMAWEDSPAKQYTTFQLDWKVPETYTDQIEIWFEGRFGEERVYDTKGGANYYVHLNNLLPHPEGKKAVCFEQGYKQAITKLVYVGDPLKIFYQSERATDGLEGTTYAGYPAWHVTGFYRVYNRNNELIRYGQFPATGRAWDPQNGQASIDRPMFAPRLTVPHGAAGGRIEMWFKRKGRGREKWDSDHEKNYVIRIGG